MKRLLIVSAWLLSLVACVTLVAAKPPTAVTGDASTDATSHDDAPCSTEFSADASCLYITTSSTDRATLFTQTPAAHRLGVTFVEAGVDSGSVGASGLLTFTFATPIPQPFGDPPIAAVEVRYIIMDLVAGQVLVTYDGVGDVYARQRTVAITLSAANESAFTNAVKSAIAAQLGTTFQ